VEATGFEGALGALATTPTVSLGLRWMGCGRQLSWTRAETSPRTWEAAAARAVLAGWHRERHTRQAPGRYGSGLGGHHESTGMPASLREYSASSKRGVSRAAGWWQL